MAGTDFVNVRLTPAGEDLAAGSPLRYTGRTTILFMPGAITRIARYEWDLQLKSYHDAKGDLFQVVPDDAPATLPQQPEQHEKENQ